MNRTIIAVAAAAVLAGAGSGVASAATAAPARHVHAQAVKAGPLIEEPWCDSAASQVCLKDAGDQTAYELTPANDSPSNFYVEYTGTWDGYTTKVWEDGSGHCLGWNGTRGVGSSFLWGYTCANGVDDQMFFNSDGYWQNAGASAGTGHAYIVFAATGAGLAEVIEQPGGAPNPGEQWTS